MPDLVYWKIDECSVHFDRLRVCGWCHVPGQIIKRVALHYPETNISVELASFGLTSPDVDQYCGPGAANVRFEEWVEPPAFLLGQPFALRCWVADGSCFVGHDALSNAAYHDAYFNSWEKFLLMLGSIPSGEVLELGSRARSAITRRHRIPAHLTYVGLDIIAGPNVDVVGDIHELSRLFPGRKFVAAFSASVFEHLVMPWKVALELNHVLQVGGLVYTATHQSFPIHEEPWDFWRFSQHSWQALFNRVSGFEIIEAVVGEPARIHPCRSSPATRGVPASPAWLGSASIVRKVADTTLTWPVSVAQITDSSYPAGHLTVPPTRDAT